MIIDIITVFPDFFNEFLETSIVKRAQQDKAVTINIHYLRDYSENKHGQIDDTPYGGGVGMLLTFPPFYRILTKLKKTNTKVIFLTPQGKIYNQPLTKEFSKFEHIILICGHYEGVDERIMEFVDIELSVGDYVLTGGEIPAMLVIDSIVRLLPGVIKEESHQTDSLEDNRLKYPQYTKPANFEGREVPEILMSGHHGNIAEYRKYLSLKNTINKRPDLIEKSPLTDDELTVLKKHEK